MGAVAGDEDGVEGPHSCTEHILAMVVVALPPSAPLAAERALAAARGCCRGGSPTCAGCLGIAEDNTSHWRADVDAQAGEKGRGELVW